jgi:hypothetical protein
LQQKANTEPTWSRRLSPGIRIRAATNYLAAKLFLDSEYYNCE